MFFPPSLLNAKLNRYFGLHSYMLGGEVWQNKSVAEVREREKMPWGEALKKKPQPFTPFSQYP